MRSVLLVLAIVLVFISGCKAIELQKDYYELCKDDVACQARMASAYSITHSIIAPVASASGVPNVLVDLVTHLASLLTGLVFGRKLYKKRGY